MKEFSLSDRYRLDLVWGKAIYNLEGKCILSGAKFSGPALAEAQQLNEEDYIMLDFFHQYLHLVRNVYVGKLSWKGTEYNSDGTISLNNAVLEHASELNSVPQLKDNDKLIIDTSDHTVEKHANNLLYKTYVVSSDKELYRFGE